MIPNSQVAKNFEVASNKLKYMLLCSRTLFKPSPYSLLWLLYILTLLSTRRLRLVKWMLSLNFERNQSLKLMEDWSFLPFLEMQSVQNRRRALNLKLCYVTLQKVVKNELSVIKLQFLSYVADLFTTYLKNTSDRFLMVAFTYNQLAQLLKNDP